MNTLSKRKIDMFSRTMSDQTLLERKGRWTKSDPLSLNTPREHWKLAHRWVCTQLPGSAFWIC